MTKLADATQSDLAADILRGCAAIAAFVGLEQRQTFHALQRGHIPAVKEGRVWVTTKTRLRKHYNEARYLPPPEPETGGEPVELVPRKSAKRKRASEAA